jgi:hypothetical protein
MGRRYQVVGQAWRSDLSRDFCSDFLGLQPLLPIAGERSFPMRLLCAPLPIRRELPDPTAAADRPASPPDRSAPTYSSRIPVDQVFDFIDGARLVFPLLTDRFGSGHATSARFPRSSLSARYCRPGDPPPRRLSSVRSHGLQSRRYPRRRTRSPGSL